MQTRWDKREYGATGQGATHQQPRGDGQRES